jgi:large subunit ribosomal protein L4
MTIKVRNQEGNETEELTLVDEVFGVDPNPGVIYEAINNEQANRRQGTHATKTRSTVNFAKSKPYRQKGTGRARAGFRGSPLWRHGGVTFGPLPRDYSYRMPRKAKRLAFRSLLSAKLKQDQLRVVDDFVPDAGKTKEAVRILKAQFEQPKRVLVIYKEENELLKRSIRNVPWAKCISCNRLNAVDLFYAGGVVVLKSAAEALNELLKVK